MTLREKIGQLFILGFHGTEVSGDLVRLLSIYQPGGVILFARNLEHPVQAASLINDLQSHSPTVPLWISIDHEGGNVFRLPNGLTALPPNGLLGRLNSEESVRSVASIGALELRAIGVNVNYAPVLDLDTNPLNPIIGERSFGSDQETVSRLGWVMSTTYQEHGILPCGKHFPGHGDTDADSHRELPSVGHSAERLREVECRPFQNLIQKGLPAIMTAHVQYPQLDAEYPASLSKTIQTKLLRDEWGFDGLIFSDDLEMAGITDHFDVEVAAMLAIEAGSDQLLICHNQDKQMKAMDATYAAVQSGRISEAHITQSYDRIMHYKKLYAFPHAPATLTAISDVVGAAANKEIIEAIMAADGPTSAEPTLPN